MDHVTELVAAAAFGAFVQEVAHVYEKRSAIRTLKGIETISYWAITLLMFACSIIGAYFWFSHKLPETTPRDMIIVSIAFPLIAKKIGKISASGLFLGGNNKPSDIIKLYFS